MESGYLNQIMVNGDTSVWEKIFEKYHGLRQGGWSEENINLMLDEYETALYGTGAYLREMERWAGSTKEDADGGLQFFRAYVMNRLHETDLYYSRMQTLCDKSIFIRRSGEYKDFEEHDFVIEIHDKALLHDRDYADLLEYMGIDTALVTDDVTFIVANPAEGKADYLSVQDEVGVNVETSCGFLSFSVDAGREYADEGAYTVYLDGVPYYDKKAGSAEEIQMAFLYQYNGRIVDFDFSRGYYLNVPAEAILH